MIQKVLSVLSVLLVAAWVLLLFTGLPSRVNDPDGELYAGVLTLLDLLTFLLAIVLFVSVFKRRASLWVALAVLAVPLMHLLGCMTESPLNLVLFLFPAGVLPVIVVFKWRAIQQTPAGDRLKAPPEE